MLDEIRSTAIFGKCVLPAAQDAGHLGVISGEELPYRR